MVCALGTMLQDLPPPPPGPLRLQDVNTVPMHMRSLVDDLMFGDGGDLDEDMRLERMQSK